MSNDVIHHHSQHAPQKHISTPRHQTWSARATFAGTVALLLAITTQLPSPSALLYAGTGSSDITAVHGANAALETAILLLACATVWLLLCWLTLSAGLALMVTALPRTSAVVAGALLRRVTPLAARRMLLMAIGTGAVAGLTACAPASNNDSFSLVAPQSASATAGEESLGHAGPGGVPPDRQTFLWNADWPSAANQVGIEAAPAIQDAQPAAAEVGPTPPPPLADVDWPTSPATQATSPDGIDGAKAAVSGATDLAGGAGDTSTADAADPLIEGATSLDPVTVLAGDSLWSIAADHLSPGASDEQIDSCWRAWYVANSTVIGPSPDAIDVGMKLMPPTVSA
ncbi:hypothetical protein EH165_04215 [Nakamurella antarctica]|uniref:LysM domain-containing protein n=1 Tax=Nakamurella antarctica TaxID=1902245 RepID=A0A3G8ZKW4_9ACTN|nr:hypothetical protein [Nakamurella antarctica]AZI57485.1 hypothetical protein EH165_04215 [Nakamurella antarctica]